MNLELDHIFIIVKPEAEVADLLLALGMEESRSRDHEGQGTSNRRFKFSNGMLEFLWVRDVEEALNGPGRELHFSARVENHTYSPFGVILKRLDGAHLERPFDGWKYQPDYFKPPMAFHVGINSSNYFEPLCIYVPFIEPIEQTIEEGTFKSISNVKIYTTAEKISDVLTIVNKADRLTIASGDEHLMEVTFDENQCGLSKDLRPDVSLIIHW